MPNASQTEDSIDQMFRGLMAMHTENVAKLARIAKNPLDPGAFLDEWNSAQSSPASFSLQVDRPALIQYILYAFTPAGVATLTIGQQSGVTRTIPIVSSSANNPGSIQCAMVVRPGDTISLAATGATALFVEVMGKVLSGTDWSLV